MRQTIGKHIRTHYFWIIALIMTACNLLDVISTYYLSPTLAYESNKWVKLLSLDFKGLVLVLLIMQLLNSVPLWFFCFKFNEPRYELRNGNSFFQFVKVYFTNNPQRTSVWGKMKNALAGVLAYAGFALPLLYIFSKIIVSIENFALSFFLKKVTMDSQSGSDLVVSYDKTDKFWDTLSGKSLLFYMNCSPLQKLTIQNSILTGIGFLLLLFYIRENYLKAVRTPIVDVFHCVRYNEVNPWVLLIVLAASIFILT